MKKITCILICVVIAFIINGCASSPRVKERIDTNTAFVYGSLNLDGLYTDLKWVTIEQYEPPTEHPYLYASVKGKVFFNQNLKKGEYCLSEVGDIENDVHNISNDFGCFEIKKPKLIYMGSYMIVRYKNGKKEILNDYSITETDAITSILDCVDAGTFWYNELVKRLEKLNDIEARKANIPRVE